MFGSEEILAFIRRQVGVRTDTDDPAGSLHAKIGSLKDVIKNYTIMQLSTISSNEYNWSTTEQSVTIAYSGAGILRNIYIQADGGSSWISKCRATVTIDGEALPLFGSALGSLTWNTSNDFYIHSDSLGRLNVVDGKINLDIPFRSSISVTIYFSITSGGGGSMIGNLEISKY